MGNKDRRIVLYVDGSAGQRLARHGKTLPIGWGVVALHDDCHHEIIKGIFPNNGFDGSLFETYAFIEGVQYAFRQGFSAGQISIYTDDQRLSQASFLLHPDNYVATETVSSFKARLKQATKSFGADAYDNVLACLRQGMVSKLLNSEFSLYHNRAHYLANVGRMALEVEEGKEPKPFLQYDDWLSSVAFTFYMSPQVAGERGILGPFQPARATLNGAVMWELIPPFTRGLA